MNYASAGNATFAMGATAMNQAIQMSPIQEARSQLVQMVESLHNRLAQLENRLDGICRPSMPTPSTGTETNKRIDAPSEYRAFLESQNSALSHACDRLDSILNRIEL